LVHEALNGPGEPLDRQSRAYFEPRFGVDFSRVRIHADARAAQSAQAVNAQAYTIGNDLVFGAGRFAPTSLAGRRLIAHELAHVAQQSGAMRPTTAGAGLDHEVNAIGRRADSNVLRRAEVEDRDVICRNLSDASAEVNNWVNQELSKSRISPGTADLTVFFDDVLQKTAGGSNAVVTPIEQYIEKLSPQKVYLPPNNLAGTRYASQPILSMYSAQGKFYPGGDTIYIVGPTIKIRDLCVGADKVGHFFQQGKQYFDLKYGPIIEASHRDPQSTQDPATQSRLLEQGVEAAKSFGRATEINKAGLATTGVYSKADLAANESGLRFWDDLMANPKLVFDVGSYATEQWNEYANPNYYAESTGRNVWATQISGAWRGTLQVAGARQPVDVDLKATYDGTVSGSFAYQDASAANALVSASITGIIRYNTVAVSGTIREAALHGSTGSHSATPIESITIEFDWIAGSKSGKGVWSSSGEQKLDGSYGNAASRKDLGSFNLTRIP
jgi:hypothetical protein